MIVLSLKADLKIGWFPTSVQPCLVSICNSEKGTIKTTRNRLINEDGILIMELDKDSLHGRGAVMCYSFSGYFFGN